MMKVSIFFKFMLIFLPINYSINYLFLLYYIKQFIEKYREKTVSKFCSKQAGFETENSDPVSLHTMLGPALYRST